MSKLSNRKIRTIIYMLIMAIGLGMAFSVWWVKYQENRFKTYANAQEGFSIQYPVAWSYTEDTDGATVVFMSQLDSNVDEFRENLSVIILPMPNPKLKLMQYTQMYVEQMKYLFRDKVIMEEPEPGYMGKYRADSVIYTVKMPQNDVKYMSIWTLHDGKSYMLTYAAYPDRYDFYLDRVKKMIKSFKITE